MTFRRSSWLVLCLLFPGMLYGEPKSGDVKAVRMLIRNAADRAGIERFGTVQDDYGSYVVMRLPEAAIRRAHKAGFDVEPIDENIGLGAFRFDPHRGGPPVLPDRFSENDHGPDPRYYLVQFRGPIRDEWIANVKQAGIETLQYVPDNALIVRATPPQIASASRGNDVRWSGLYHPAYKLSDDLGWLLGKPVQKTQADRQLYRVGVFRGHDLGKVTSSIVQLGGRIAHVEDVEALYFRTLLVELDTERVADVSALREICRVETWYPPQKEDERSNQVAAGNVNGSTVTATGYASFLTTRGVNGTGIAVGVVDDGVDVAELHLTGRVTDNATIRRGAAAGADGHGHHDAGIVAGQCTHADPNGFFYASGMAPQAHIINIPLLRAGYFSTESQALADIVETTAGNGSRGTVATNSWGAGITPSYGAYEAMFDALVHDASSATAGQQPLAVIFSAGNGGSAASTITAPKAAKNILVVGASENYRPGLSGSAGCGTVTADNVDQWPCFSSRGPAADGRIRPDISVPGTWIASARAGFDTLWGDIDANHRYSTGTSQAAPHVAGATALIQQWWKMTHAGALPAPALSKAMLINGAVDPAVDPAGFVPNNTEGWGRMNLGNVLGTGVPTMYNNQANVLTNAGDTFVLPSGVVASASKPFRVTLVWSDAPGAAGANPALVNNLDLEVTVGGNTYKGNVFASGASATGGAADTRNNVEAVYFPAGAVSGTFNVTVRLTAVGGDGAAGTGDATDQHFALVVYNATTCSSPLPPSPAAAANGNNRIDVTWSAVAGATSYKVLRATSPSGPFTQLGTPSASPYVDTTVTAFVTYYYAVRAVGPTCESGDGLTSAMATGVLSPPANAAAVIVGPTSVELTWTQAPGALTYRVFRTANNSSFTLLGTTTGTTYIDATVAANTAYLYKIRSVNGAVESGDSSGNRALATIVFFTDNPLPVPAGVKTVHVSQLRTAINLVRVLSNPGGGAFSFTDAALSPAVRIKRVHLTEMRATLDGARAALGLPPLVYTDPVITALSTTVKRAHITQLRQGAGTAYIPAPLVSQLLLNPGFELGAVNWTASAGVIDNDADTARTGTWKAWLNGYGFTHTDTLEQQITIPSAATVATLSFWLHIETDESTSTVTAWDPLQVQLTNSSGTPLTTLATYSNLNYNSDYEQKSFDVLAYKGQTIRVRFVGREDSTLATSFYIDDTALTVTQPAP